MTCAVFYPRVRLLSAAADRTSTSSRTLTPGFPKPNPSVEPVHRTSGKSTFTNPSSKCRDSHLYGYNLQSSQPAIDPISRSDPVLCSQLDANNGGSMDPGGSKGLQVGTGPQACTTQATSTNHHEQKGHSPHEIEKMVTKGVIVPVAPCNGQFLSQMFLVPKKDGSARQVVNLKALTCRPSTISDRAPSDAAMLSQASSVLQTLIKRKKFKMKGAHLLRDLLHPGDWMASIDLKDTYFSVTMAQQDRKLLRFSWQGLTFGLSSAP